MMRTFLAALALPLALAGCSGTVSDAEARDICAKWVQDSRPGYEVELRDPVVAEEDRMVTIAGTATKGSQSEDVMCAVDIREGKVIAGFG